MSAQPRSVTIGFRWEPLAASVGIRFTQSGRQRYDEALSRGERVQPDERHELLTYSFAEVRRLLRREPGVYLIEAFHTAPGPPSPDPGSMSKELWSDIADYHHERHADPEFEPSIGEDPLWFYIGMAGDLVDRFEGHEQRRSGLRRALEATVNADDVWLRVSIQRDQVIRHAAGSLQVDLHSDLFRVLLEHAAIADYRSDHPRTSMLNIERA